MPRFFTLSQAEAALPAVETSLRQSLELKSEYQTADAELDAITQQIQMMGGVRVDAGKILAIRARKDSAAVQLKERLDEIQEAGCLVKDLDVGLIDFPTLYRGQEVYLCWRFGEDGIEFWHGVDEGFRGRKAIDDDFRNNHRGDSSQGN